MPRLAPVFAVLAFGVCAAAGGENLVANGGFEAGLEGWHPLWTRAPKAGEAAVDRTVRHGGRQAARIVHTGARDWSFGQERELSVEPGQVYELGGWVRLEGAGRAELCVVLRDAAREVISWTFAGRSTGASPRWRLLRSRFVVPPAAATLRPRWIGTGEATVWVDDTALTLEGTMDDLRPADLPASLEATSATLHATLYPADGSLALRDRRSGRLWRQHAGAASLVVRDAKAVEHGFDLRLLEPASMLDLAVAIRLDAERPEVTVRLAGEGELRDPIAYPPPFRTAEGTFLVMPVNEGISYPVDDPELPPMSYHLYGGHGLCMPWWGLADGETGLMSLAHTADDARVRVPRLEGLLCVAPEWEAQKGRFGYDRVLRYVLFDRGGYVAMAKRYRQHAEATGLLKTLAEKRKANPHVDLLAGAVNVWCWERDAVGICRELLDAGIRRVLWSHRRPPDQLRALNEMGVLTSRYDIYQDVMDPANFPKLRGVHPDWTTEAWPDDLMIGADGQRVGGWRVRARDGSMIPCGVLCDRQAVAYARQRISEELRTHPYRCRFIDTTTASPWRECYHPDHPMTRTESKTFKMRLLGVVSQEFGLVCGSETGHDAAVPVVHYFEGMMSLGPYRIPNAGRDMRRIWHEVPERVAVFQTGHRYRLPLWELVYHDCVVAQWYWGDYNNKLPALWDRRDLWNALYGTPPMFMFDRKLWRQERDRFVRSYRTATPVARATAYAEMLSHEWLSDDHAVQRTRFANGVEVVVNFADEPRALPDGTTLGPLESRLKGLPAEPR
ncbi:MAG: glycoside hydrolase [Candidatus Brocadiia bacterium]